jgi:hypothetical protein
MQPTKLSTVFVILFSITALWSCKKEAATKSLLADEQAAVSGKKPLDPGFAENDIVMYWNDKAATVLKDGINQPTRARLFAIIQIAVYDALNNIKPKYQRYALLNERTQFASPDAAVASAAYWAIKGLNKQGSFPVDTWYNESLATIPDGESKELGKTLGRHAAEAIIANRANDGFSQTVLNSTTPPNGVNPGEYRSTLTAVNWQPTKTQFAFRIYYNWGTVVKPYVAESNSQFRPQGPLAINSNEYANDFNEVKSKGARVGGTRTEEEDKAGKFWTDTRSSFFLNLFVSKSIENKKLDAWKTARLFALMHVSVAETINSLFDAAYYYYYWRPETAIRLAASDANNNTQADPDWLPVASEGGPTVSPPLPGYPSSFASFGGATAETLRLFFGTDETSIDITTTSINPVVTEPRPSYHFSSFSEIASSNSNAMIYNGWDFRKSAVDGEKMGRQVAGYVFSHHFKEE